MGLKIKVAPAKPYTILDALEEFITKKKKGTLMFISIATGRGYKVVSYDPKTRVAKLHTGYKRQILRPVITEREAALYTPLWR